MNLPFYCIGLTATALIAISPTSKAHGISASHFSAVETHDNDRHRHSGIYFVFPYGAYGVSYYDAEYCYTPTAEQIATAQDQVQDYLLAVRKHRKHPATHRYISVETLRPTKEQFEDYSKKRSEGGFATGPQGTGSSTNAEDPSKTCCLMVYDTQTKQFVGSGCYLVGNEPPVGDVSAFQTISVEFVGRAADR
jgi:hypothetical protein